MESTEPIQLSDIHANMKQAFLEMGISPQGANKLAAIIVAHVNKSAVLNNFSKKTLRYMLWKVGKTLYKDMTKNREQYGNKTSKETIVTTVTNALYLTLNRGVGGEELKMFYGANVAEQLRGYAEQMRNSQQGGQRI